MTVQTVPLKLIAENPLNVRRDIGDVGELADSIRAMGLLEPLIVAPAAPAAPGPDGIRPVRPYVLVAGHRRLAAARLLAFDGITVADIAKKTGRSTSTVKNRITITALPDGVQNNVHAGTISLTDALVIAEFADDPDAVKVLEDGLGTWRFEHDAQRFRRAREATKEAKKTRAALAKAGVTLLDPKPDGFPWQSTEKPFERIWWTELDPEGHATCPGHAAVLDVDGTAQYICTDPETHHPRSDDEDSETVPEQRSTEDLSLHRHARELGFDPNNLTDAQRAEAQAAADESARVREVLANAADVRRAHLDKMLEPNVKLPEDTFGLFVALTLCSRDDEAPQWAIDALGVPVPADLDDESEELTDWFVEQVRTMPLTRIARLALRSLHDEADPGGPLGGWTWRTPAARAWMSFLVRAGYPISPEETARMEAER
jgi:ParB family chromosome partitioning protein